MSNQNPNVIIGHLARSNLTAQFSEQMAIAAIPILAVVALGASAEESATLQAINTLPFLLLSIPAGLLADRLRRKPLMIATFGARPLGAALGAWLSAAFGVESCLIGVAIGFSIQLGIIALSAPARLPSIEVLDQDAAPAIA